MISNGWVWKSISDLTVEHYGILNDAELSKAMI